MKSSRLYNNNRALVMLEELESRTNPAVLDTFLTTEHVDLGVNFSGSSWSLTANNENAQTDLAADRALLYVNVEESKKTRPANQNFDFLGVASGQEFYQLPTSQNANLLYLGVSAEATPGSAIDSYNPSTESNGRVTSSGKWVRMTLTDVKGAAGGPAPGIFSVWQDGSSAPNVFMSTSDGITSNDSLWILAGGHQHFNFGFSAPGRYEVTVKGSAFSEDSNAGSTGAKTESSPVTYYFSVGSVGQINFDNPTYSVNENGGSKIITVNRTGGADGKVTVNYSTTNGTATSGSDYTSKTGSLTFGDLETSKTIVVPIIDDAAIEGNETMTISLSSAAPANIANYLLSRESASRHLIPSGASAVLTIVDIENSLPTISSLNPVTVNEDSPVGPISFTIGDSETPVSNLVVTAVSSNKVLVPDANISLAGTGSSRTVTLTPISNQFGTTTISITVADSDGGTAQSGFQVTFDSQPDDPVIGAIADVSILEDTAIDVPIIVSDADGQTVTLTIPNSSSFSTLASIAVSGTVQSPILRITPVPNASGGPVSVTVRATDTTGRFAERTFNLSVQPVNDSPTVVNDSVIINENAASTFVDVLLNDSSAPENDGLTIQSVTQGTKGGTVSLSATGVSYTPASKYFGTDTFTYTVVDGGGEVAVGQVTVVVVPGPRSPVGVHDVFAVNSSPDMIFGNVLLNDTDANGDKLAAVIGQLPTRGTLEFNRDGSFKYDPFTVSINPPSGLFSGADSFTYTPVEFGSVIDGHVDLGVGFSDGAFDLHIHDEENDIEYSPDEGLIYVSDAAKVTRPENTANLNFDFIGALAGSEVWIISEAQEIPGVVFLGLATEEIGSGIFQGDTIDLNLVSVSGPGEFSLWNTDGIGGLNVGMASSDGIGSSDKVELITGSHQHFNYAFSAAGRYEVRVRASGTTVLNSSLITAEATYVFSVGESIPIGEPVTVNINQSPRRAFEGAAVEGHTDIGIGFTDGAFDLHIHDEENDIEYSTDTGMLYVSGLARQLRGNNPNLDFIGVNAGQPVWILPSDAEVPGLLFLGFGTEEIVPGTFKADSFKLNLLSMSGPGHFSMWNTDGIGGVVVRMATSDGVGPNDSLGLIEGSHGHYNIAFTQRGRYEITLQANASMPDGSPVSATGTYIFSVDSFGAVSFNVTASTVVENSGKSNVILTRTGGVDGVLKVNLTASGNAVLGRDYSFLPTITFADGQSTAIFTVNIIDDILFEETEGVAFRISNTEPLGSDGIGSKTSFNLTIRDNDLRFANDPMRISIVTSASGPTITLQNIVNNQKRTFRPLSGYRGLINTALADVNGDGHRDVIIGTASQGKVVVVNGKTGQTLFAFNPFGAGYLGGVNVGGGDINNDGRSDIVVGVAKGSAPHVKVYNGLNAGLLASFYAFSTSYLGGVRVSAGDINGDGKGEIVVGTASGLSVVAVFNSMGRSVRQLTAFGNASSGVDVFVADLNRDGKGEIIVGTLTGVSRLAIYNENMQLQKTFLPFGANSRASALVSVADINGDGNPDILVSAFLGRGGEPQIAAFQYLDLSRLLNLRYALSSFDETVLLK